MEGRRERETWGGGGSDRDRKILRGRERRESQTQKRKSNRDGRDGRE